MKKIYSIPSILVKEIKIDRLMLSMSDTNADPLKGVDAKEAFDFDLGDEDVEVSEAPEAEY